MKQTPLPRLGLLIIASGLSLAGCSAASPDSTAVATEVAVHVAKVTRADLHAYVEAYGVVESQPAGGNQSGGAAKLAAPTAGIVMAVPAKEGERVPAGTIIVKLNDRAALASVDKANHTLAFATQVVERQDKLKAIAGTSDKAMQEAAQQLAAARADLATAQAQLALVQLATPVAGIVSHINVQPGQAVDFNTIVAEVVDLDRITVTTNVPAAEATALKLGQAADIFAEDGDQVTAKASVSFVSPSVDAKTGAVLVRLALPRNASLRPGQTVRARIVSESHSGLAVPVESVVRHGDGHSVIAKVEGDQARQQPVEAGLRDGALIEIRNTQLKEGDTVVTVGAYGLPKESKVRVISP